MKRNIILISITILFALSTGFIRSITIEGKPNRIIDLEDNQKSAYRDHILKQMEL